MTDERPPAFDTEMIRDHLSNWPDHGRELAAMERSLRLTAAELAMTEETPIQMLTAVVKLAENAVHVRETMFSLASNFERYLDACDGKQVAEQAGGEDGLG